jgi:hypothetical protein
LKPCFIILSLLFCLTLQAQVPGCTDPLSKNYNPQATINDGSCEYKKAKVKPVLAVKLADEVVETSGLIHWNNSLYTQNDDTDTAIYALDTVTGAIANRYDLTDVMNQDWEELAQDEEHIYIGDFGNNRDGSRTNLHILKVAKASLTAGNATAEAINFTYSDQTLPAGGVTDKTDFDCEAMVVTRDSIYLFTKQWNSKRTSLYALPKTTCTHVAQLKATHDVDGLITGATHLEDKNLVVLTGYSKTLKPFFYLLYDFKGHDFFSGNKRKVKIKLPFHQIESITTTNGLDFYITNEFFSAWPVTVKQKLHKFDLAAYLSNYLEAQNTASGRN